ncbi:prolipoprotein diacylglyceryl transferase, partial [Chloroflexota bacterium]
MTISMDPIIFNVGSHPVGWHGIMMVTGIIVAVLLSGRWAEKEGITAETVYTSAFWIVLFGLIGARLSHVIDDFDFYSDNISQIPAVWEGGMGWYGGYVGGIVGGVVYAKLTKIPLGKFADAIALGGILGLAIGRIGCTMNGDAYGTPASLPWGLTYTHVDTYADLFVKGHPAPVYEIIWILSISIALWLLSGKKLPLTWLGVLGAAMAIILNLIISCDLWTRCWVNMFAIAVVIFLSVIVFFVLSKLRRWLDPPGSLFLATMALYSFGRFFISWARAESDVLGPLHQAHIF